MKVSSKLHAPATLLWERNPVPTELEAGWVWMFWRRQKSPLSAGIRTPTRPTHNLVNIRIMLSRFWEYDKAGYKQNIEKIIHIVTCRLREVVLDKSDTILISTAEFWNQFS